MAFEDQGMVYGRLGYGLRNTRICFKISSQEYNLDRLVFVGLIRFCRVWFIKD